MQFRNNFPLNIKNRISELGGVLLIGFGIILVLSTPLYTPLFMSRSTVLIEATDRIFVAGSFSPFGYGAGIFSLITACIFFFSGYMVLRKHANCRPDLLFWLIIVEILAETTILGWLLMTSGLVLPLPSSRWGIITARWLEHFFGVLGSIVLPLLVLCLCQWFKRLLRKSGSIGNSFQAHTRSDAKLISAESID